MTYQGIELSSYLKELYSKYLEVADIKHSDKAFEYFIVDAFIEFYKLEYKYFNHSEENKTDNLEYLKQNRNIFEKKNNYRFWFIEFNTKGHSFIMCTEASSSYNISELIAVVEEYFKPLETKLNEIQRI